MKTLLIAIAASLVTLAYVPQPAVAQGSGAEPAKKSSSSTVKKKKSKKKASKSKSGGTSSGSGTTSKGS